jgi:hypothetical protein
MTTHDPMICPRCKIPMNRHGELPCAPRDAAEARAAESGLGVIVEQAHTCPSCGRNLARREAPTA